MTTRVTIQALGPLFAADPTIPYWANVRAMLEGMAAEGEAEVISGLRSGEGTRAPLSDGSRVSEHIAGRVAALSGKQWYQHAVVSPDKSGMSAPEAIALYAAASRIETETHVFKKTATRLRASRAVQMAELTKGLT